MRPATSYGSNRFPTVTMLTDHIPALIATVCCLGCGLMTTLQLVAVITARSRVGLVSAA